MKKVGTSQIWIVNMKTLAIIAMFVLCQTACFEESTLLKPTPQASNHCVIEDLQAPEVWKRCLDKSVKLKGIRTPPERIGQHPSLAAPSLDPNKPSQFQEYMDVGSSQIILLTRTEIRCEQALEVEGVLKEIDLGGEKGTKNEYRNWFIEVATQRCL